jgi:hypothetical protein
MLAMIDLKQLAFAFDKECADYRAARRAGDVDVAWRSLERGHILSQPLLSLHLKSHGLMLAFAINQRDSSEAIGQLVRLLLAPLGALTGKIPWGNSGRANVSPFQPMAVPDDLAPLLDAPKNQP